MDVTVTAAEAGLSPDLLDRVERGEEVVITRNGRAVARLCRNDATPTPEEGTGVALTNLDRLRERVAARGGEPLTLEEALSWRHEGHRH